MNEEITSKNKKEWHPPELLSLDFKDTLGGRTEDTGEDTFIDVTSG
jgi:hypothetical protein